MQAFTIDADNNITVFASSKQIERTGEEIETFSSPQELAALAVKWPGARVVEIWNSLPGVEPVQRFTSRQVAAARLWKAIQQLKPASGEQRRQVQSKKGGARNKAQRPARPPRPNSKTAEVIALLRRSQGATLGALMQTTGWQAHSVRGFISGKLGKKMGLRVHSFLRDQERVYAIKR
jgi:uncharacterized protein DUF3489